jgi:hypothetical protein
MIVQTVQAAAREAHSHVGQGLLTATGGSFVFGLAIEEVSKYLQAGAFAVAMLSGLCASIYYSVQTYYKIRNKGK